MAETFANRARTTLAGTITNSATSFSLTDASTFPAAGTFRLRIEDEIMIVGARSGNALSSVQRGQEGTTAVGHTAGVDAVHPLTAASLLLAHQSSKIGGKFLRPSGISQPIEIQMPYKGLFIAWTVLNDATSSVQYDVQKTSYASYPSSFASIAASDKPTTTSARKGAGSCTGWTSFDADDIIRIICETALGVEYSTVLLATARSA